MDEHCKNCKHEIESAYEFPCADCVFNGGDEDMSEQKIITNADRIRSMTDEELAEFLSKNTNCDCCNIQCPNKFGCSAGGSCSGRWEEWLQKDSEV